MYKYFSEESFTKRDVAKVIHHYFPETEMNDRSVLRIRCKLWQKQQDIDNVLKWYQKNSIPKTDLISFHELYVYYLKYCKMEKYTFIVNKLYFEKYVRLRLHCIVLFDEFVTSKGFFLFEF